MTYAAARIVTSTDRWTCPTCSITVVIVANPDDTRWCLRAAMHRHGHLHARNAEDARRKTRRTT